MRKSSLTPTGRIRKNARSTVRGKAPGKRSRSGRRSATSNIDAKASGAGKSSVQQVRKWIRVMRPPAPGITFKVPMWVPVEKLTRCERDEYLAAAETTEGQTGSSPDDAALSEASATTPIDPVRMDAPGHAIDVSEAPVVQSLSLPYDMESQTLEDAAIAPLFHSMVTDPVISSTLPTNIFASAPVVGASQAQVVATPMPDEPLAKKPRVEEEYPLY